MRLLGKLLFSVLLFLCLFEGALRIYNPIPFRLKGDKIILPINQTYQFDLDAMSKVDKHLLHTKNSLGFRGEEMPKDFENLLSIIAVGGSTTECFFLSNGQDWPTLLGDEIKGKFSKKVWINNAGLNGHSSFGHLILLKDYLVKLKPKVILFLIGVNELFYANKMNVYDRNMTKDGNLSWMNMLARKSEVLGLLANFKSVYQARVFAKSMVDDLDLTRLKTLKIDAQTQQKLFHEHEGYIESYKQRLRQLIEISRTNGILPIFITQPTLVGVGRDPITGVDLENLDLNGLANVSGNGQTFYALLERYNDAMREASVEAGVHYVDLAKKLPKNSNYYYDLIHFTKLGSEKISEILTLDLIPYLQKRTL